jgi:hypothetical protein
VEQAPTRRCVEEEEIVWELEGEHNEWHHSRNPSSTNSVNSLV